MLARLRADPRGWLEAIASAERPVILDEIQNAPELFPYLRTRIDSAPRRKGRFILTGSQDFSLMRGVAESMAGRAAIFHLLPFSIREVGHWELLRGGYPEVHARPRDAATWFRSYVQTYLERDVRAITAVHDLGTFRRFLALIAARNGQMLNKTDIAAPLGVSVPTVGHWLDILETTGIVMLLPPYFESLGKRIVKTPKLYFLDTGLLCHLLGYESLAALSASTLIGPVFEAFVASELVKRQLGAGRARELYWFRDHQGLEVDFIVPERGGVLLVEAKWSRTITPDSARGMVALLDRFGRRRARGVVVHRGEPLDPSGARVVVVPHVQAETVEEFFGVGSG